MWELFTQAGPVGKLSYAQLLAAVEQARRLFAIELETVCHLQ